MTYLLALLLAWLGFGPADQAAQSGSVDIALDVPLAQRLGPLPSVTPARGENPPLVVIDPGHGGRDPGATSPHNGALEKDTVLALARAVRDELARSGRVRTALTREDDRYLPLHDRYEIARALGADLFISLHADAAPANDTARGATIYTLSEVASDQVAAALASRENAADRLGGTQVGGSSDVNMILIDLTQRESMNRSADFAQVLHREASGVMPFRPVWHRFAAFVVLKAPDIPSILFESGYMTNAVDVAYMRSPEGREAIATGMRRAIEAYFARRSLSPGAGPAAPTRIAAVGD